MIFIYKNYGLFKIKSVAIYSEKKLSESYPWDIPNCLTLTEITKDCPRIIT